MTQYGCPCGGRKQHDPCDPPPKCDDCGSKMEPMQDGAPMAPGMRPCDVRENPFYLGMNRPLPKRSR